MNEDRLLALVEKLVGLLTAIIALETVLISRKPTKKRPRRRRRSKPKR